MVGGIKPDSCPCARGGYFDITPSMFAGHSMLCPYEDRRNVLAVSSSLVIPERLVDCVSRRFAQNPKTRDTPLGMTAARVSKVSFLSAHSERVPGPLRSE